MQAAELNERNAVETQRHAADEGRSLWRGFEEQVIVADEQRTDDEEGRESERRRVR